MNVPCYRCEERHSHCHVECERYKEYEQQNAARREKRLQEKMQANAIAEDIIRLKCKTEKRKRLRKG